MVSPTLSKRYQPYSYKRWTRLEVRSAETVEDFMTAAVILDRTFGHLAHSASYFADLAPGCTHVLLAVEVYDGVRYSYETIQGVYLLRASNLSASKSWSSEETQRTAKYVGLRGVEGVALAVDPTHRGKGAGRLLREHSYTLDYDYIWGMQFKSLNNLDNWLKSGRELIYESGTAAHGINCTARMMPEKVETPEVEEPEEETQEVSRAEDMEQPEKDFPIQIQRDAYSCGATCVEMYLNWVSQDPNEVPDIEEIKTMCGTNDQTGTITEGILDCMDKVFIPAWRSSVYQHTGTDEEALDWLETQLTEGKTFFVRTLTHGFKHWILTYGFYYLNGTRYWLIADPAAGLVEFVDQILVHRWKPREWDGVVADINFAADIEGWSSLLGREDWRDEL